MGSGYTKLFLSQEQKDPEEIRRCPTFQYVMREVKRRRAIKRGEINE